MDENVVQACAQLFEAAERELLGDAAFAGRLRAGRRGQVARPSSASRLPPRRDPRRFRRRQFATGPALQRPQAAPGSRRELPRECPRTSCGRGRAAAAARTGARRAASRGSRRRLSSPWPRSAGSRPRASPWLTGSRPENGSSRTRSRGELTSAVASWTFCAMPLDSLSTVVLALAASPKRSSRAAPSRFASPVVMPLRRPK